MPDGDKTLQSTDYGQSVNNMTAKAGGFVWLDPKKPIPAPPRGVFSTPESQDLYRGAAAFSHALRLIGVADLPVVMVERLEDWAVLARAGASHSADEFLVAGITFRRERKPVSRPTDFYK